MLFEVFRGGLFNYANKMLKKSFFKRLTIMKLTYF